MPSHQQQMLRVLQAVPESAFESLEDNPTTRLDLELSIHHGDVTAFSALCYSAWLAEEKGQLLGDEHWPVLGQLADQLGERESLETYWPRRLPRPWPFSPGRPTAPPDERVFAAMKGQGKSVLEVAQALRDSSACEVDAVRILRELFGLSVRDAITLIRAP